MANIMNMFPGGGGAGLKYATGTAQISGTAGDIKTITVSELGFRPYAVCMQSNNLESCGYGACDASGEVVSARVVSSSDYSIMSPTFTPGSDGFSIQVTATGQSNTWTWYAFGP